MGAVGDGVSAAPSAVGVSLLVLASQIAYDAMRIFGAGVLIVLVGLGIRLAAESR